MTASSKQPSPLAWAALFAIFAGALAFRLPRLGLPGLSSDEAFSWRLAQYGWAEIVRRAAADVHPPLYFLVLKGWLGLWGASAASLRGLSVVLGLAAIAIAYALCRRASRRLPAEVDPGPTGNSGGSHAAGLFAALLVAIHAEQVLASRNARMYTLGMVLASLSAYFLWRAIESPDGRPRRWWVAHGAATAAFLYTHYYGWFTLLAQAVWILWECAARWRKSSRRQGAAVLWGSLLSGSVTLVLFGPWIPTFLRQTRGVREHYWIQPVSGTALEGAITSWTTGLGAGTPAARYLSWLLLAAAVWIAWRVGKSAVFFLVQAGVPWLASLGLSAFSGRTIFLERYLIFSQFFFLVMWSVAFGSFTRRRDRLALAALLLPMMLFGLGQVVARYPRSPSATELAVVSLARHDLGEDMVLTTSPRALNRFRFYAAQARLAAPSRCVLPRLPADDERFSHVASLEPEDILWADQVPQVPARRLWRVDPRDDTSLDGWSLVAMRVFEGGDGSRVVLTRFQHPKDPPGP